MTTEKSQKITIEIQARITIDGIEPNMPFLSNLANAVMESKQTVIDATPQKPKELLPQQQPLDMSKNNEQRYGDKNKKMVTLKQVDLLNKLANERHFSLDDVCAHYGVSNVNLLNQKQMQEVFDKYKRM